MPDDFDMNAFSNAINAPSAVPDQGQPSDFNAQAFSNAINAPSVQQAQQILPQKPMLYGSVLPISKNPNEPGGGQWGFDPRGGIIGDVGSALNFPRLAHEVGAETAANTATPQTAGDVLGSAALLAPGDMMAPGISGKAVEATAATPSEEGLHAAAKADRAAAREMGVDYSIPHVVDLSNTIEQQLYNRGTLPTDAPRTYAKLAAARDVPDDAVSVPLSGLMGIRKGLSKLTADKSASNEDRAAAALALGHFQGFLENPPPEAVLAGPAASAGEVLTRANANDAAAFRSELVSNRGESAELGASRANSGRNYDNILRQKISPLVDPTSPQRFQLTGFTEPEKQALRDIVAGSETRGQNALRTIGNMGAGGHGMGATVLGLGTGLLGEHIMGPAGYAAGIIPPAIGSIARTAQNRAARNAVEGVAEKIRQRSPLYQERAANAGTTVNTPAGSMALTRGALTTAPGEDPSKGIYAQPEPGHPFYARGGKVKKPSHEFLVNRLMALAEKAKRAEKKSTAPILNMPDDAVTAALAKAQEAI